MVWPREVLGAVGGAAGRAAAAVEDMGGAARGWFAATGGLAGWADDDEDNACVTLTQGCEFCGDPAWSQPRAT